MKILITGGAGFVGSHLAERLVRRGDSVCVLDDLSAGSTHNIRHLQHAPGFEFVQGDVTNRELTGALVDAVDVIYHLAAAVGVQLVVASPSRTIETNVRGAEVVLELAARKKKRVLITSSSEVYGRRNHVPFREDDDLIIGPPHTGRWGYACSKLLDEFLAVSYWREKGVPTVVTRLFSVVGPRQAAYNGMVIPNLVNQALSGGAMTVYGDGSQRRCFTHVEDAITALIDLAEHPAAVGEVYNVGSTNEITILDLARRIKRLCGSSSEIVFVPYERASNRGAEDIMRRVPDLTKINKLTGYSASRNIDDLLRDTIAYRTSQLRHSNVRQSRAKEPAGAEISTGM